MFCLKPWLNRVLKRNRAQLILCVDYPKVRSSTILLLPGPLKYKFDPAPDSPSLSLFLPPYFPPFLFTSAAISQSLPITTATDADAMTACLYLSGRFPLCRKNHTVATNRAIDLCSWRPHIRACGCSTCFAPRSAPPAEPIRLR